ncbi:MAG: T9SS type A sorting domain-containing protein [Cryomorphaceae bacterium]|nr:T9SS type A sorting domain-containing protein [Cryomorphaceae bacterium]
MKIYLITLYFLLVNLISVIGQTVSDIDGNVYNTVSIGNQVWLGENLKVTKYNNQDPISLVLDDTQWSTETQAAYCYYQGDISNTNNYGNLYNWYVVNNSKNVCPTGYHVPSITEWEELITFLGGNAVAGGKLKEIGFAHWLDPNTGADNSSGFTLLPSGWRAHNNGFYESLSYMAYVWSSTSVDASSSSIILAGYDSPACYTSDSHIRTGLPIRCLKDETSSLNETDNDHSILVYPNPANDLVNIHFSIFDNPTVKLTDTKGQIVLEKTIVNNSCSFDLSTYGNGVYFIQIEGTTGVNRIKIVVQH